MQSDDLGSSAIPQVEQNPLVDLNGPQFSKAEWRQIFKSRLDFSEDLKEQRSEHVCANLRLLLAKSQGPVGVFAALPEEPRLRNLVRGLNLDWCFPKVENARLQFYRANWDELQVGSFGVLEPVAHPSRQVAVSDLGWCLVPALGYDRTGVRLGRGKGFYDRSLQNFRGVLVGVGFSQAISARTLPVQNHDVRMNWIVTDQYLLKVSY